MTTGNDQTQNASCKKLLGLVQTAVLNRACTRVEPSEGSSFVQALRLGRGPSLAHANKRGHRQGRRPERDQASSHWGNGPSSAVPRSQRSKTMSEGPPPSSDAEGRTWLVRYAHEGRGSLAWEGDHGQAWQNLRL